MGEKSRGRRHTPPGVVEEIVKPLVPDQLLHFLVASHDAVGVVDHEAQAFHAQVSQVGDCLCLAGCGKDAQPPSVELAYEVVANSAGRASTGFVSRAICGGGWIHAL